jgi:hypothetical protein
MSRSVTVKRLDDEASAGWTTYGTFRAAFSLFQGVVKHDLKAPQKKCTVGCLTCGGMIIEAFSCHQAAWF